MSVEKQVRDAIVAELLRQAEAYPERLKVETRGESVDVDGKVDVDELVMAVVGSVAGGP